MTSWSAESHKIAHAPRRPAQQALPFRGVLPTTIEINYVHIRVGVIILILTLTSETRSIWTKLSDERTGPAKIDPVLHPLHRT